MSEIRNDGTYVEVGGRPAVRFERRYPYPVERLWQAVTDPGELRHWFPSPNVEYDPREGGRISLTGDPYDPEGSVGTVLIWDPPHRFAFEWGEDQLHLTIAPDGDGCRLELLDLLATRGGAARNGTGWDFCLAGLGRHLAGTDGDDGDFLPVLQQYIDAGLPDDGWRPGDGTPPPGT
ncbi:SRPBCC family protein [Cumulibacter manganitolerans]|uniref:SRPBCC family protein n=1 Tax=Cumulibacter manganitolerans TaxID=1884992 RepID=UPI001297AB82|nr:SRPBCC family protein [Cumulibacter manganitolerans]